MQLELYEPKNGLEAVKFLERKCWKCKWFFFNGFGCDILRRSTIYSSFDYEYPKEWVLNNRGIPTCTEFKSVAPKKNFNRCKETIEMYGEV